MHYLVDNFDLFTFPLTPDLVITFFHLKEEYLIRILKRKVDEQTIGLSVVFFFCVSGKSHSKMQRTTHILVVMLSEKS